MLTQILPFSSSLRLILFVWLTLTSIQKTYTQVIDYETIITVDEDGRKTTLKKVLLQINNKQENWLSHIEIRHNPKQDFLFNHAHLIDKDNNIVRKLKKKELKTRNELSYQAFYQDDLITEFDLYWDQYPYQIEYSYEIEEEEYLYLAWWTPLLYSNIVTIGSSLEVNLPTGFDFRTHSSKEITFESFETEDTQTLLYRSVINKKHSDELYSPSSENLIPFVKVVPATFSYGIPGKLDSWSSFGQWIDKLNEGTDQLTVREKKTVERLIEGIEDKSEIIKTLYHYLQDHTKYVNVAIDVGGLKSYPASYVCDKKYGDCKALTTYMKALLKEAGIDSYYTTIKAGSNKTKIEQALPSQQFNHVILMVPSEKDTIWLENTSSSLPYNYLGTFTQNRSALAVNGERSKLVKTPKLSPSEVLFERNFEFRLSDNETDTVGISMILRGKEFENFRYFISERDRESQNEEILDLIRVKGFKVSRHHVVDFERDKSFVKLNVTGTSSGIVRKIGPFQVINPLRILLPPFEKPDDRKLDVYLPYPIYQSDKSNYELKITEENEIQLPEKIRIESEYGKYHTAYERAGDRLLVNESFLLYAKEILVAEYAKFYEFIDSVITHKKTTAILIK